MATAESGSVGRERIEEEGNQDFPLMEVPPGARRPDRTVTLLLFGFTLFVGSFYAGGQVGAAFPLWALLAVIFGGSLLLGLYVAVLGVAAQKSGLSTVLLARFGFGDHGSKIVDSLLGFTQVGWFAWQISLPAVMLAALLGQGWRVPLLVLFGALFAYTAYVGVGALAWLSRLAVPAILVLVALSLALALGDAGGLGGLTGREPSAELSLAAALTIVFGSFASGGTQSLNWTRFASTPKGAFVAGLSAFALGNGLMLVGGAVGALVYGQPDLTEVLNSQGLLVVGLLLVVLSIWVVTQDTVYAFSVAGANLFRTENRRAIVVAGSLVGVALAIGGFYEFLEAYLILLGTFIPPVGAVIAADYFVKRRMRLPALADARLPAFNWAGVLAYVAGSAVAYLSPGIPPVNGLVAAFLAYLLLDRALGSSGVGGTVPDDAREEAPGVPATEAAEAGGAGRGAVVRAERRKEPQA